MHDNPQLKKAYGTPVIAKIRGRDVVVSPAANWVYGYDPATGEELEGGIRIAGIFDRAQASDWRDEYIGTSYMRPQLLGIDVTKAKPEILGVQTQRAGHLLAVAGGERSLFRE